MEAKIDSSKVLKAFDFHGVPLMRVWTEENGLSSLSKLNILPDAVDTSLYRTRQKFLNQNDNFRRLRLHKFMCQNAEVIFKKDDPQSSVQLNRPFKTLQSKLSEFIHLLKCKCYKSRIPITF